MSEITGRVVTVVEQDEDHVLLSIPMVGFPPGFELRPGERVVLVDEPSGYGVRPLVRSTVVRASQADLEDRREVDVGGQPHALQDATVVNESTGAELEEGARVIWVVDPGSAEGPKQVIAVRPATTRNR